jgi:hypothetical protein
VKIERGGMAWAEQPTLRDTPQTQVSLFMRTGSFARENLIAFANEQQIDGLKPHTEHHSVRQTVQRTDRNPVVVL